MFALKSIFYALLASSVQSFAPVASRGGAIPTRLGMSSSEEISLDPSDTAVVFIEYQNEFTSPGGKFYDAVKDCMEQTNMLENSVRFASRAREAGCTIIHCPISFEPVGFNHYYLAFPHAFSRRCHHAHSLYSFVGTQ